jgi:hypothetical protein
MKHNHFFGFISITDFIQHLFGVKYGIFHTFITSVFTALTAFIGVYVWADPFAVYTLWCLMAGDFATGVFKGIKTKTFVSYKLWRMPLYFIITTALLSASFWMAASTLTFTLLPTIVLSGFMSVYFVSLLENLGELGLLPKPIIELLKNRFGFEVLKKKFLEDNNK